MTVGHVGFLTSWAENFNSASSWLVSHAQRQKSLTIAMESRASPVHRIQIFLVNFRETGRCVNEALVNPAIHIESILVQIYELLDLQFLLAWHLI